MSLRQAFQKTLSANDVGATDGHQGGILIPKSQKALLDFLPPLDPEQSNPDAWIECIDEDGEIHRFRYVYYNKKLHGLGTRNEYRITHMTGYLGRIGAKAGDVLEISRAAKDVHYSLRILPPSKAPNASPIQSNGPIKLKGWNRVH